MAWSPGLLRLPHEPGGHDLAVQRVAIIGTSDSGKSTLGAMLADRLRVPYIELDSIFHQPNWTHLPALETQARVQAAAEQPSWVIDGSYSTVRHVIWPRAECIVWLDLPRPLVTYRVLRRTVVRCATRQELWNGNRDRWRDLLSTNHAGQPLRPPGSASRSNVLATPQPRTTPCGKRCRSCTFGLHMRSSATWMTWTQLKATDHGEVEHGAGCDGPIIAARLAEVPAHVWPQRSTGASTPGRRCRALGVGSFSAGIGQ